MTNAPDTPMRKPSWIPDTTYDDRRWSGNDVRYQASRVQLIGEGPGRALIRLMGVDIRCRGGKSQQVVTINILTGVEPHQLKYATGNIPALET